MVRMDESEKNLILRVIDFDIQTIGSNGFKASHPIILVLFQDIIKFLVWCHQFQFFDYSKCSVEFEIVVSLLEVCFNGEEIIYINLVYSVPVIIKSYVEWCFRLANVLYIT